MKKNPCSIVPELKENIRKILLSKNNKFPQRNPDNQIVRIDSTESAIELFPFSNPVTKDSLQDENEKFLKTSPLDILEISGKLNNTVNSFSLLQDNPNALRNKFRVHSCSDRLKLARSVSDDEKAISMSIPNPTIENLKQKASEVKVFKILSPCQFYLRFEDEYHQLAQELK